MSVMQNLPFALSQGALIVAEVSAMNVEGWGLASSPNTVGVYVQTVPL